MDENNMTFTIKCGVCGNEVQFKKYESIQTNEHKIIQVWSDTHEQANIACECGNAITF